MTTVTEPDQTEPGRAASDRDADVIDRLVGLEPGHPLFEAREIRPEALAHAQGSFEALFRPDDAGTVTPVERWALAAFVAALHESQPVVDFYADGLRAAGGTPELVAAVADEALRGRAEGPYGAYPDGPLAGESVDGPEFSAAEADALSAVSGRLPAALDHAHFLVFHPRDAAPARLRRLADAGWSADAIVTISQLVAFLTYQIRVVHGLATLKEAGLR
ncbi:CMD domain protein [Planctomonas psychrotolerans]|uniref:CMD domain protein n=1 Tax=Planctomonas psychrotolerans TaxID=2528712 RepID=UPI00123BA76B|nr:CMD domain protein [Planctomonas psychrotolerans]